MYIIALFLDVGSTVYAYKQSSERLEYNEGNPLANFYLNELFNDKTTFSAKTMSLMMSVATEFIIVYFVVYCYLKEVVIKIQVETAKSQLIDLYLYLLSLAIIFFGLSAGHIYYGLYHNLIVLKRI